MKNELVIRMGSRSAKQTREQLLRVPFDIILADELTYPRLLVTMQERRFKGSLRRIPGLRDLSVLDTVAGQHYKFIGYEKREVSWADPYVNLTDDVRLGYNQSPRAHIELKVDRNKYRLLNIPLEDVFKLV